ncbi:CLUMA_CG013795, isoform A [Clunio marinus]|uniref:CLUMA_CG013795, isoform A n=1 Tax=Clunio marinus TaxID=568069 RepID=A0A1J1IN61_9DIPT|nr:CLUMA_CG013795, isoform A [Clunio marinus]
MLIVYGGRMKTLLRAENGREMGRNSLLFHPYGQLLLMYDVRANKKSWTDSYSTIFNKYDAFIGGEAMKLEDQNAIKIDDYENLDFNVAALHVKRQFPINLQAYFLNNTLSP